MAKSETPFHKISMIRARLDMYVEYGERALQGQTPQEFAADVRECFGYLMDFRNIVSAMASLNEAPKIAVRPYLSDELVDSD